MEYLVIKYFTKEISDEELNRLVTWLNGDYGRRELFFEMKDIYDSKNLKPTTEEIEDLWSRICFSIGENSSKNKAKPKYLMKHYSLKRVLSYSASVAMFFLLFFIYKANYHNREEGKVGLSELYIPAESGVMNLLLSDGTKVYLKGNTRLKFPTQFNGKTREIYLDGEAFFDVAHNAKKPFVITTNRQKIEVLGTSLNVRDFCVEKYVNTTLITGRVKLLIAGEFYTMHPQQQLCFDSSNNSVSLSEISAELSKAFSSRKYHFKEKALSDLFKDIEKLYGVKIRLQKKSIGTSKYTGTFSLDQSITEILNIINYKTQFAYGIKEKNQVTIY